MEVVNCDPKTTVCFIPQRLPCQCHILFSTRVPLLLLLFPIPFSTVMKKKKNKIIPNSIDCIPKYSPQPRSSPPKRRTDFSVFTCTPSLFNPVSSSDSYSRVLTLSNGTAKSLQERKMEVKQFPNGTLVQCSYSEEHRSVCPSGFSDVPVKGVDSAVHNEDLYPRSNSNSLVTPGSVVWARTASQMWWPAEVMEKNSTLSNPASDGHVLVHFYGNQSRAWINPTTDISAFEDSFEERSTNPSTDFHKALKQALHRKEQLSSCRTLNSDRYSHCNQQNHSSDKWTSCNSSAKVDDFPHRGRSRRERKRKVHFDEVTFPLKSERTTRRLKIMRYLGLVAPVGSPF